MAPNIIKQTKHWAAINKPPSLVVHDVPGEKHAGSTLVDWAKSNIDELNKNFPKNDKRPGIVHRLDADTSGIILIAKDQSALKNLQDQFRERTVVKTYWALVLGDTPKEGMISGDIVRKANQTEHQVKRLTFSWDKKPTKEAITGYKLIKQFSYQDYKLSLLEIKPKTGRTHQIRVHLSSEGWPIIGDQLYNTKESRNISSKLSLNRQFLHAKQLEFDDSESRQRIVVSCDLAPDLQTVLDLVKRI